MPQFLCLRKNFTGRFYHRGKVYSFDKKPNHHFVELDKQGEVLEDDLDIDTSTVPNFDADGHEALMAKKFTKKAIVDHVKENYETDISQEDKDYEGKADKKKALVTAAIKARENYVPKPVQ